MFLPHFARRRRFPLEYRFTQPRVLWRAAPDSLAEGVLGSFLCQKSQPISLSPAQNCRANCNVFGLEPRRGQCHTATALHLQIPQRYTRTWRRRIAWGIESAASLQYVLDMLITDAEKARDLRTCSTCIVEYANLLSLDVGVCRAG
jgi:hypothetical protein